MRPETPLPQRTRVATELPTIAESLPQPAKPWPPALRVGFRFWFAYCILFTGATQIINSILIVPHVVVPDMPDWATLWPVRSGVIWTAQHVFRDKADLIYTDTGSGDKTFDWVLAFCILVLSLLATAVWSAVDRKQKSYPGLSKWFRLFLRVALASQMFVYGFAKVVPLQIYFPFPFTFLEPFRHFSPMGILFASIGISPAYEIFTGCAEVAGGFLLIFPRTVTLGALICLADMIQVFVLDMTYDVCVKLFSFHLIVFSLLLLAPDIRPLFDLFILNRPATLVPAQPLFRSPRANRITRAILAALWLWMIAANLLDVWKGWHEVGTARPKPALYGVWTIDELAVDGQEQPLIATNGGEWRRMTFDLPNWAHVQRMDDTIIGYDAAIDAQRKTLALTPFSDENWHASFSYSRPAADELLLDGAANGHKEHIRLRLMDDTKFPLTSRGFHWIQDVPFRH
jgi:uncharacterized membrane protein YphA (DoxX/SURF4 family)